MRALQEEKPDALLHVGFGHGLWGMNAALAAIGWDPPRYTTTAFELAYINDEWMRTLAGWVGLDAYDERNAVGQAFLDRFEQRYGRRPTTYSACLGRDVGTVILTLNLIIWFLAHLPFHNGHAGDVGSSILAHLGAWMEPLLHPLGFNRAVGIWGGTSAIAAASGPIVGGLLVQHVSWESIFLLNVPLGAVAALVTFLTVAESRDETSGRGLDPPGVLLLTSSLAAITWALIKAQDHGWGSAYVLAFGLAGRSNI